MGIRSRGEDAPAAHGVTYAPAVSADTRAAAAAAAATAAAAIKVEGPQDAAKTKDAIKTTDRLLKANQQVLAEG